MDANGCARISSLAIVFILSHFRTFAPFPVVLAVGGRLLSFGASVKSDQRPT
jgi:hypothetical protein